MWLNSIAIVLTFPDKSIMDILDNGGCWWNNTFSQRKSNRELKLLIISHSINQIIARKALLFLRCFSASSNFRIEFYSCIAEFSFVFCCNENQLNANLTLWHTKDFHFAQIYSICSCYHFSLSSLQLFLFYTLVGNSRAALIHGLFVL